MTDGFTLEFSARDGLLVARLAGELDRVDADEARERILGEWGSEYPALVCDLGALGYLDSAGVHLLHALGRAAHAAARRIAAVFPQARTPRKVLEVTGMPGEIPLFETLEEALQSVSSH